MRTNSNHIAWAPVLPDPPNRPIYRALADAMAEDIATGRLVPGQQLPTHRALAKSLGVDLTTITRAYAEANRRGLVEASGGRGTFVRTVPGVMFGNEAGRSLSTDTGMNPPPQPEEASFRRRLSEGMAALASRPDLAALLTYSTTAGSAEDREAGAVWLHPLLPTVTADRVLVCAGAQAAFLALLTSYVRAGELVLTESLTYRGFRALAAQLGIQIKGVAMDSEGLIPEAFEKACREDRPKALYCGPTIHNPTTATMSPARREAIASIARRHGLLVFEDDSYGFLPTAPLPPLASFLPELTFYVSSLAKCIAPGLRIAYLVTPGPSEAERLRAAIGATVMMTSPLMAALATHWIADGSARAILGAIRRESAARQRIAGAILPKGSFAAHPQGHHLWLDLPPAWDGTQFAAYARQVGLAAVAGAAFSFGYDPAARKVRLALGAAADGASLEQALRLAAGALAQLPDILSNLG
jgi:DNA-binding transcriptional MocR family regulator